jgi:periplasmic mercuric ion binding protein
MKSIRNLLAIALSLLAIFTSKVISYEIPKKTIQVSPTISIKDTTVGVYGNCSLCKKSIEKAAKSNNGVEFAIWNKISKILNVQYDQTKTSITIIEKSITAIGYDTEHMHAEDSIYNTLHFCCRYQRKP